MPLRQRDRFLILFSLAALALIAWVYLVVLGTNTPKIPQGLHRWMPIDFVLMFLMWAVMMIAMMVPSAMRTVLIYAGISARARSRGQYVAPVSLFVLGYLAIWTLFSFVATVLQWGLEMAALLSPMMISTSSSLGTALLISAGIYQFTPLKKACLRHCQSPAMFMANQQKKGLLGAFQLGVKHGLYCLGCCWVLMGLLFLGGVMNLLWILAISLFVLAEKILPARIYSVQLTGLAMISSGFIYLVATI
jgi:predicted metal-binding membrane protein